MNSPHTSRSSAASWHEMSPSDHRTRLTKEVGFLLDGQYLLHDPGSQHPESPQRLTAIRQMLQDFGAFERWQMLQPRKATVEDLELIHHPVHIQRVEQAVRRAPAYLDVDTAVSTASYETALLAAGGVLECMDALCVGTLRRIFAFIRPPGHHANAESARGFCLFNNAALAAAYARTRYGVGRIAIVDFDVHHGDGTQSCFYGTPEILYVSTHQFPFYPGTGDFHETGDGEGKGYTLNLPLPENTGDSVFVPIYSNIISAVLDQFEPQIILVSAGLDGHHRDPLGGLALTHSGYASAAASLMLAAERWCNGKICFILEGGYSVQGLQDSTRAIMTEMEKRLPEEFPIREGAAFKDISRKAARFSCWKW
jgi:acetoin utilization deacetylase AcuC-like enzyme